MKGKLKLGIVISGGGTTCAAIVEAWQRGEIPEIESIVVVSTDFGAPGVERMRKLGVEVECFPCMSKAEVPEFNAMLYRFVKKRKLDMLSLHGCDWQVCPIVGVFIGNSHPAVRRSSGGRTMTGIAVHEDVLFLIGRDIKREWVYVDDVHYTAVNYHEIEEGMDRGDEHKNVLTVRVVIPNFIVCAYLANRAVVDTEDGEITPAKALQKYVMDYERRFLPGAIGLAAMRILKERAITL